MKRSLGLGGGSPGAAMFKADGTLNKDGEGNPVINFYTPPTTLINYSDATYKYVCEAAVGSARSSAVWQVMRITIATNDIVFAGTGLREHAATDLATVGALTYTLGA